MTHRCYVRVHHPIAVFQIVFSQLESLRQGARAYLVEEIARLVEEIEEVGVSLASPEA